MFARLYRTVKNTYSHWSRSIKSSNNIKSSKELGQLIRIFRKNKKLTLEKVSGLSNLGMRFISELERGKETVELGKVLQLLNNLGLEVIVQPRGTQASKDIFLDGFNND